MKSNFDFLKEVDKELYDIIIDSEKLFLDGYFNQCVINTRIFAETLAKKIYGKNYFQNGIKMTFDDILNCLKDDIKNAEDKELVNDMFFIKKEGNNCAHGESTNGNTALDVIKRAFEASINYSFKKGFDFNNLLFDDNLLITGKIEKKPSIVEKYVELATLNDEKQELLNKKQEEFLKQEKEERQFDKEVGNFEDLRNSNLKPKAKKKKELTPAQKRVKSRIKEAKKELKTINKPNKSKTKKQTNSKKTQKNKKKDDKRIVINIIFYIFTLFALYILSKLIF